MTADRNSSLPPAKALKKVCELYRAGNFSEARRIIMESAGITPEERNQIPAGEMGRYIAGKTKNPNILKMLQAELAFYSFSEIRRTDEPTEHQAERCVAYFEKILPFLHKFEKTHAKYCIACCHDYMPDCPDTTKYEILNDIISELPKHKYDSDRFSLILKINDLSVPIQDKYNSTKKAQQKTSPQSHITANYSSIITKLASKYYDILMQTAQNRQENYQTRNQAYETVLRVIDDLALSKLKKNSYKLALLEQQTNLQREYGDKENYLKSNKRKHALIRQQGLLKYKLTGQRSYDYDNYR